MKNHQLSIFSLLILAALFSCTPKYGIHGYNAQAYKGKFDSYLSAQEKAIYPWYHFVISQHEDGRYIYRQFFPETMQITKEASYQDAKLTIPNGPWKTWFDNGLPWSEGRYNKGLKDGYWKNYSVTDNIVEAGNYVLDKKHGEWTEHHEGQIKSVTNYVNGLREVKFVEYDSLGVISNEGIFRADTIFSQSKVKILRDSVEEHMPYLSMCGHITSKEEKLNCSSDALLNYIYKNIEYPKKARALNIQGTAYANFVIDRDGSIIDVNVYSGLCADIKNSFEKVINNMPLWEAGMQQGKKVKVMYTLPIKFYIEN